tara:strand:+ start:865 stop:1050 length:186 start_codon:yes stop_codon:yes gene_type:complete
MARILRSKMSIYNESFKLESEKKLLTIKLRSRKDDRLLRQKIAKLESKIIVLDEQLGLRRV